MLQIGRFNILKVSRLIEFGAYLESPEDVSVNGSENGEEVLLPVSEEPEDLRVGDTVEAFVYLDSEDRPVATMRAPLAEVGEFACLKVVASEPVGAFLDWGLKKDLFLPHAEQTRRLKPGESVVVFVYLDKSGRIAATMRLHRHADKETARLHEGEAVELMIVGPTDLGLNALINRRHMGVIYKDEVFRSFATGELIKGFIKKVRDDGKVDLRLTQAGHKAADEEIGPKILELLKAKGGFLAITDKTSAEAIHELFGVSKKKYKIALGGLYKRRMIRIDDDGIRLV